MGEYTVIPQEAWGDEEKDDYEIRLLEQNTNRHVDNS